MPSFPPYFKLLLPVVNQVEIIFVYQVKNLYMTRLTLLTYLLGFGTALLRTTLRVELLHRRQYSDCRPVVYPSSLRYGMGACFFPSMCIGIQVSARWLPNRAMARLSPAGWRIMVIVTRGSTTRGGSTAFRRLLRQVRSGRNIALTVDGPQGPARVVQPGIVRLARLTKAFIVPVSFSSSHPWLLRSWDRFLVPKPFSQNFVAYGEPFVISKEMSDEAVLTKIRVALDDLTEEADRVAGIYDGRPEILK